MPRSSIVFAVRVLKVDITDHTTLPPPYEEKWGAKGLFVAGLFQKNVPLTTIKEISLFGDCEEMTTFARYYAFM